MGMQADEYFWVAYHAPADRWYVMTQRTMGSAFASDQPRNGFATQDEAWEWVRTHEHR